MLLCQNTCENVKCGYLNLIFGKLTILVIRKLETLGYTTVETASLCVPLFSVPECDGQIDRRYTLRSAVKSMAFKRAQN